MKKLLAVLLALAVVGVAFAQDAAPALKFSGAIYGGVGIHNVDDAAEAPAVIRYYRATPDAYANAWRTRINGAFTDGNYGLNFRLQTNALNVAPALTRSYIWANFMDGMINFKAGRIAEGAWQTSGDADYGNIDSVDGMSVNVKPIAGLQIGAFVPVSTADARAITALYNADLGLAYSVEGLGDFQLGFQGDNSGAKQSDVYFGFNLTAVENLTFALEVMAQNLGEEDTVVVADNAGLFQVVETVEYAMGDLALGLIAYQNLYQTADAVLGFSVDPYVTYTMGDIAFNVDFYYAMDAVNGAGNVITTDAIANWSTNPNVTFTLGKNEIQLGAILTDPNTDSASDKDMDTDIYALFTWNF